MNNYHPPRYPNLVSDETLPSLWRWLRAETNMERSECTLAVIGRVASSPDHIFGVYPTALSKKRIWKLSLGKLGPNWKSLLACCRTNQIAWGVSSPLTTVCQLAPVFLVKVSRIYFLMRLQCTRKKKKQGLGTRLLVELFLYHTLELGKYQLSLSWYLHYQLYWCTTCMASFPGSSHTPATESWAGPWNKATTYI